MDESDAFHDAAQFPTTPRTGVESSRNRDSRTSWASDKTLLASQPPRNSQIRPGSRSNRASAASGDLDITQCDVQPRHDIQPDAIVNGNRNSAASWESAATLRDSQLRKYPRVSAAVNKNRNSAASYDSGVTLRDAADAQPTKIPRTSARYNKNRDSAASWDTIQKEKAAIHEVDVKWDGPEDPTNPYNWKSRRKNLIVANISILTLITPLASTMFAPGVPDVLKDFHSKSQTLGSFVVSVYVFGYVAGPLLVAPLSEHFGRTGVYHVSNILFVVFTAACALSTNLNMLVGFRFLQGTAGATPMVLGGSTVGDMFPQEQRGRVMSIWASGPLLGPVIGPVIGGFVAETIGWRWIFWILVIASGILAIISFFILHETYEPILLKRKARGLKRLTKHSTYICSTADTQPTHVLFARAVTRPTKMLLFSPIVLLLAIYMAIAYGYQYLLFSTMTEVFQSTYGFGTGIVGLAFIGIGVGTFAGLFVFSLTSDARIKRLKAQGVAVAPETRLPPLILASLSVAIGLFWYGWSANAKIHWIMPIIGTVWIGMGIMLTFMPIQTYLVDSFTVYAASAIAANTVVRSLVAAVLPLAGQPMYSRLGLGWGNSLLAFVALLMIPVPLVFTKYGEWFRTSERFTTRF